MSNTNWGFLITFTQKRRGRLRDEGNRSQHLNHTLQGSWHIHALAVVEKELPMTQNWAGCFFQHSRDANTLGKWPLPPTHPNKAAVLHEEIPQHCQHPQRQTRAVQICGFSKDPLSLESRGSNQTWSLSPTLIILLKALCGISHISRGRGGS